MEFPLHQTKIGNSITFHFTNTVSEYYTARYLMDFVLEITVDIGYSDIGYSDILVIVLILSKNPCPQCYHHIQYILY